MTPAGRRVRAPRRRHFLMCPPTHFEVSYAINPWMDPARGVDRDLALRQWWGLVEAFRSAGHRVDLLDPVPGLPDMVYAANGATVVDGRVLIARFANPQRAAEADRHEAWHRRNGILYGAGPVIGATAVNEAEGDFAVLSDRVLAGHGFRTTLDGHRDLAALTGREVISLRLVDPRFYHLDVALTVLDDRRDHLAYYPGAFAPDSLAVLERLFPDAIIVDEADALAFALNSVSDGLNVFVPIHAAAFRSDLVAAGYRPMSIDLSELLKGGGSVKCCTQEIRAGRVTQNSDTSARKGPR